ncbi:MAG: ATP-dependent Clp protease adaptor ClpS [Deltaproteobacteria bacterium]|nr:MAG: ATP-dependent Clp protease adaptor ClpS [Deltaproteobacteria bacterium]
MGAGSGRGPDRQREGGVALQERPKTKKPPLYKVLLHNDDYTTKEFVVMILQQIFHHSEADAIRIMEHVHNHGIGVAGVYPFEIAETKAQKTVAIAQQFEYPLQCTLEPES